MLVAMVKVKSDARYAKAKENEDPVLLFAIREIFGGITGGGGEPDPDVLIRHSAAVASFTQKRQEKI